ncbi:MAG: AAA family ATPase [Pseudomonadales bacterium]|nr:AAA family ATPase [Pseudomonadales bacterium]
MRKILILGNSGAGKSTLSKKLSADDNLAHLDLDILAFKKDSPMQRRAVHESIQEIKIFLEENDSWVIEGGYADIFEQLLNDANEMIFLDLPAEACQENARNRAWEPHKYKSKEAQDKNLEMLINWILDYYSRDDAFSKLSHNKLFDQFSAKKTRLKSNQTVT